MRATEGTFSWSGHVGIRLGGNLVRIGDSEYELNPEIHNTISITYPDLNDLSDAEMEAFLKNPTRSKLYSV